MKWRRLVQEAAANPSRYYDRPRTVLRDSRLSPEERLHVLEAWEQDARAMAQAEAESMTGGEPSLLRDVSRARLALLGACG